MRVSTDGVDAVGTVPSTRWVTASRDGLARAPSFLAVMQGAELFDGAAFSVSDAEATATDPQQRQLLEHGYEALFLAGRTRAAMLGDGMGVLLGITNADFTSLLVESRSVYAATGGTISIAAGRLSYVLAHV